jgi:hypothetical protein
MADQANPADQQKNDQQDEAGKDGQGGEDQRIPYQRFEEVNKRARQAEKELADLRSKILEFEDRDKSEVDRERSARQRAESQLAELTGKVTSLEKGSWVRSVAAELNFHDPEDAVQHLRDQLGGLEDQTDARRLVRNLAKSKKHLIREEKKEDGRPSIGQMFSGQAVQQQQGGANGQQPQRASAQQIAAEREAQLAKGLAEQLGQFRDKWHQMGS